MLPDSLAEPGALGKNIESTEAVKWWCDDPELRLHLDSPWLIRWIEKYIGQSLSPPEPIKPVITDELLSRGTFLLGIPGTGKTRMLRLMAYCQIKSGCSALFLEALPQGVREALQVCKMAGVPPKDVVVIDPKSSQYPGWNPLAETRDPDVLRNLIDDWATVLGGAEYGLGARMEPLLKHSLHILAIHRGSIGDLSDFLYNEKWRRSLLIPPPDYTPSASFRLAVKFFERNAKAMLSADWAKSFEALTGRLEDLQRADVLIAMLTARQDTVRFPDLWKKQRVIIAQVSDFSLGNRGAALFGGMLSQALYQQAMRAETLDRSVVLAIDELSKVGKLLGGNLAKTLAHARSRNIRVLFATQYYSQLGEEVRTALTGSAIQAFFQPHPGDASVVARDYGGKRRQVKRIKLSRDGAYNAVVKLPLSDLWGRKIGFDPKDQYLIPKHLGPEITTQQLMTYLVKYAGAGRVYAEVDKNSDDPTRSFDELYKQYGNRLEVASYWPLQLSISLPKPKIQVESETMEDARARFAETLQHLKTKENRECILRLNGKMLGKIRVRDFDFPSGPEENIELQAYRQAAEAANGLAPELIPQPIVVAATPIQEPKVVPDSTPVQSTEEENETIQW